MVSLGFPYILLQGLVTLLVTGSTIYLTLSVFYLIFLALVSLLKKKVREKYLKPDLEKIKRMATESENEAETIDECAMRNIQRSTTVKVINKIIRLVERADTK